VPGVAAYKGGAEGGYCVGLSRGYGGMGGEVCGRREEGRIRGGGDRLMVGGWVFRRIVEGIGWR
jgi:hypothetical protein